MKIKHLLPRVRSVGFLLTFYWKSHCLIAFHSIINLSFYIKTLTSRKQCANAPGVAGAVRPLPAGARLQEREGGKLPDRAQRDAKGRTMGLKILNTEHRRVIIPVPINAVTERAGIWWQIGRERWQVAAHQRRGGLIVPEARLQRQRVHALWEQDEHYDSGEVSAWWLMMNFNIWGLTI